MNESENRAWTRSLSFHVRFHRHRCRLRLFPLTRSASLADGMDGKVNGTAKRLKPSTSCARRSAFVCKPSHPTNNFRRCMLVWNPSHGTSLITQHCALGSNRCRQNCSHKVTEAKIYITKDRYTNMTTCFHERKTLQAQISALQLHKEVSRYVKLSAYFIELR